MFKPALRALLLLLPFLAGCQGVSERYVAADRLTHAAVAPEYRRYVERDAALSPEQKQRRLKTLAAWAARLRSASPASVSSETP